MEGRQPFKLRYNRRWAAAQWRHWVLTFDMHCGHGAAIGLSTVSPLSERMYKTDINEKDKMH